MALFRRNNPKDEVINAFDQAAGTLYVGAGAETVLDNFPDLDSLLSTKLQGLLFYTRAAIIIGWLRRLQSKSGDSKWQELLNAFERLIFPGMSVTLPVVMFVRRLSALIDETQEMKDDPPTMRNSAALNVKWWNEWLGLALDPEDIAILGLTRCLQLSLQVIDETHFLATAIADVAKDL